jgi:hypothetical protein
MNVNNHDVAGLHARLNRFVEELFKSVSSSTSQVNAFDQTRMATYLDSVDEYRSWVVSQPQLDLPETHPRPIELEDNPVIEDVENESVNDVIRMLQVSRDELINSQSAREASGLNKFDASRLVSIIAKVRAFLNNYIAKVTPLDLPESSPQSESSGPGRQGI